MLCWISLCAKPRPVFVTSAHDKESGVAWRAWASKRAFPPSGNWD